MKKESEQNRIHKQNFLNFILSYIKHSDNTSRQQDICIQLYSILSHVVCISSDSGTIGIHPAAEFYTTKQVQLLESCIFETTCELVRVSRPRLKICSPHFLLMYSFKRYSISLSPCFFISKIRVKFFYMLIENN